MIVVKTRYEGVFERDQKVEIGEVLKAGKLLGKIATHNPNWGLQEILFSFDCRIVFILKELTHVKKGDIIAQLQIIPD